MIKKQIVIRGKTISYIDNGDPSREAVLMLHGFPESSLIWKEVIPLVEASGYRAIAPDLPGFGQSERFDEEATWELYMLFLDEFLSALNLQHIHLFVHDWGGLIGLRWACHHPERVLSLLPCACALTPDYTWHKTARALRTPLVGEMMINALSDRKRFEQIIREAVPRVSSDIIEDFYNVLRTEENRAAVLELYRSGDLEKLKAYQGLLRQIKRPVTMLFGAQDHYVPYVYGYIFKRDELPQADVHVIPHAGHFALLETPIAVKKIVEKHFRKLYLSPI